MLRILKEYLRFRYIRSLLNKHERVLIPIMLLLGVVVDFLTFRSIQISTAFLILGVYVILAGGMILFMHAHDARKHLIEHGTIAGYLRLIAPFVIQFTFGALLSAGLVFYWFSGSFFVSWPFLFVVVGLMIANEIFREYYLRPSIQLSVYFFVLFLTLAVALPTLFGSIASWIFYTAGGVSLFIMILFLRIISFWRPDIKLTRPSPYRLILGVFVVINIAYVFNVIPPIPLSLTDSGVYYSLSHEGSQYFVTKQPSGLFEAFFPTKTIEAKEGQRLYVFASIFAPVDLDTSIYHNWQYLSEDGWVSMSRPSYNIVGGRAQGYRGYSFMTHWISGRWRVDVETQRGQVIGRINFKIKEVEDIGKLITEIK